MPSKTVLKNGNQKIVLAGYVLNLGLISNTSETCF